jgi:hypothetical protein
LAPELQPSVFENFILVKEEIGLIAEW